MAVKYLVNAALNPNPSLGRFLKSTLILRPPCTESTQGIDVISVILVVGVSYHFPIVKSALCRPN